jgi:hypothetical protein
MAGRHREHRRDGQCSGESARVLSTSRRCGPVRQRAGSAGRSSGVFPRSFERPQSPPPPARHQLRRADLVIALVQPASQFEESAKQGGAVVVDQVNQAGFLHQTAESDEMSGACAPVPDPLAGMVTSAGEIEPIGLLPAVLRFYTVAYCTLVFPRPLAGRGIDARRPPALCWACCTPSRPPDRDPLYGVQYGALISNMGAFHIARHVNAP